MIDEFAFENANFECSVQIEYCTLMQSSQREYRSGRNELPDIEYSVHLEMFDDIIYQKYYTVIGSFLL